MKRGRLSGGRRTRNGGGGRSSHGGGLGQKRAKRRGGRLERGDLVGHVGEVLLESLDEQSKVILEGEEDGGGDGNGSVADDSANDSDDLLDNEEVCVHDGVEENGSPERANEGQGRGVGEVVDERVQLVVNLAHGGLEVLELGDSVSDGSGDEVDGSVHGLEDGLEHVGNVSDDGDTALLNVLRSGGGDNGSGHGGGDSDSSERDHFECVCEAEESGAVA